MEHINNSIWYKLGLFFCWILNLSPILHISRDKEFDSITQLTELRISIFSLPWGDKNLYFISLSKKCGFELFSVLRVSDLQPSRSHEDLVKCESNFLYLTDNADGGWIEKPIKNGFFKTQKFGLSKQHQHPQQQSE
jgi:hypothetical protein